MDGETGVDLPAGWVWARLGEIGDVTGGLTKNSKRVSCTDRVPYLRVANVKDGRLDLTDVQSIGIQKSELPRTLLQPGDLLIVEGNGSLDQLGRCAVWTGAIAPCVHQNHIIKVRFRGVCSAEWAAFWLASARGRRLIEEVASSTSGLHTLSISKVADLAIPVAPLPEQARILAALEAILIELDEAEAALSRARERLADYRASLLHAACTGALTADWRAANPAPAEDGPALLRRILAERRAAWERAELARLSARGQMPRGEAWKDRYREPRQPDTNDLPELPPAWVWVSLDQMVSEPPRNGISVQGRPEPPGTPALRLDALTGDGLRYERRRYIEIPSELAESLAVKERDFLVSRANGSRRLVGRACVAGLPPEQIVFPDTMIRFRLTLPRFGRWLAIVWQAGIIRAQLEARAKTSAGIWKL